MPVNGAIPTLDEIAANPQRLDGLDAAALAALALRANAAAGAIAARLAESVVNGPAPTNGGDHLLTAKQLAQQLGVKESWVATEARAGRIPRRMVGRYVRFDLAEVQRALAEISPRRPN